MLFVGDDLLCIVDVVAGFLSGVFVRCLLGVFGVTVFSRGSSVCGVAFELEELLEHDELDELDELDDFV